MLLQKQALSHWAAPVLNSSFLGVWSWAGHSGCAHSPSLYPSVTCKSCYCVFVPGCEDSSQVLTCDYVPMLFNILMHRYNNTYLYTCVLTHTYLERYFCHCFTKYGHLFTFFCFNNCLWRSLQGHWSSSNSWVHYFEWLWHHFTTILWLEVFHLCWSICCITIRKAYVICFHWDIMDT